MQRNFLNVCLEIFFCILFLGSACVCLAEDQAIVMSVGGKSIPSSVNKDSLSKKVLQFMTSCNFDSQNTSKLLKTGTISDWREIGQKETLEIRFPQGQQIEDLAGKVMLYELRIGLDHYAVLGLAQSSILIFEKCSGSIRMEILNLMGRHPVLNK